MGRKNRTVKIRKKSLPDVTRIQPPKRMDIWYAHLRENTGTSVQEGSRPVLVISNDIPCCIFVDSEPSFLASCLSFAIYWLFEFPMSTFIVQHQ